MIKRYNPNAIYNHSFMEWQGEVDMEQHDVGGYVTYEDYKSLEADYNVLRRDYESLQAGLKKLYLES